ncbi:porin [Bizionia paragorgiae]|jgi:phosphate-selective porin OprO and OprP|uniref:porin n=1 Tax=Bizionia paragorgiae TaxID=283786 RepID=UPI00299DC247|nr:porin [Bizionia paragorgiae]MDX1270800.1 porin [Bizionia paragorgiae]
MKSRYALFAFFIFTVLGVHAQETKAPKFGDGLLNLVGQDSSWTMKIGARAQLLTTSSWEDGGENSLNFLVRRARLKFNGYALTPKLQYKIQLGLSNRDMAGASPYTSNSPRYILDAYLKWNFYKNFAVQFGQGNLPGNRETLISSGNLQFVDRSRLTSIFSLGREFSMQLSHHFMLSEQFKIKETVSIAQGEGRNVTTGNEGGLKFTGRVEVLPFGDFKSGGELVGADLKREETPKLALALAYDYNGDAVKTRSNQGGYMDSDIGLYETDISTLFIDAMFKYQGFSFMAEYANRKADDPFAKNEDDSLTGDAVQVGDALNFQSGYVFPSNWEISGRYTTLNLDQLVASSNKEQYYTLGVSKYIRGHKLKVQSDLSYLEIANSNNEILYRLQVEIHF